MFKFHCPHCNQRIEADDSFVGEPADCPACSEPLVVPSPRECETQAVESVATQNNVEGGKAKTTSATESHIYLVYDGSGGFEIFDVEPRFIKNERFSAKVIDKNRGRSFPFSGMLGLFEDRSEAEALLAQVKETDNKYSEIEDEIEARNEKLEVESDKIRIKIERLEEQHYKLEERLEKKWEITEALEERSSIDVLTEKQAERLAKASADATALEEKMSDLEAKMESFEELDNQKNEEFDKPDELLRVTYTKFINELQAKCLSKLNTLGLEDRTEAPIPPPPPTEVTQRGTPPPLPTERMQDDISNQNEGGFMKRVLSVFKRKR